MQKLINLNRFILLMFKQYKYVLNLYEQLDSTKLKWHPVRDSNPCCRRERAVS